MSGHNAGNEMAFGGLGGCDPGASGVISVEKFGQLFELVSGAANESRTLLAPTRPGVLATIRLKTDGGGDVTVTCTAGLNVSANTAAVFADAGDQLVLLSVSATTGYRWEILVNTGSVSLS